MGNRFYTKAFLILAFFLFGTTVYAGGIKGYIRDEKGEVLPFATIFVRETGSGATTNVEGYYEISLSPGKYTLVFQYLGFATQQKEVTIGASFQELNVQMQTQTTVLPTMTLKAGNEDPAYAIMRKAIAKANYHRNELDFYSAKVYIKGAGKVIDYPFLLKREMEKEGIQKGRVFVSESVNEVKYTRPNKYEQKVLSVRSDGKDNNSYPGDFIFNSFYEPTLNDVVTPFSPKAFSYYKFEYIGTFDDQGYSIIKIKVIPRTKGENILDGYLFLVEDWWSIHSLDLNTVRLGIKIGIKSIYTPIDGKVWLPVTQKFKVNGKFFGVEFSYDYLSTVRDYKITINPEVYVPVEKLEVVDEKTEKAAAAQAKSNKKSNAITQKKSSKSKELQQRLEEGKEISRKELNMVIREYEKQELKEQKEPDVVSEMSFKVDSLAFKKDSIFWDSIRPVPLTQEEIIGYKKTDSLAAVEQKKAEGDTLKNSKHKGFQPLDLIVGDYYRISKHSNFRIHALVTQFNTVEGYNLIYKLTYGVVLQDTNRTRLTITPAFRYAFSRKVFSGNLNLTARTKRARFEVEAGRYIAQYNNENPILPFVNTITTLLMEQNLMKIYERDYIDLKYRRNFTPRYRLSTKLSYMRRRELENTTNYKWVNRKSIEGYTPNRPVNGELANTGFDEHEAFIGEFELIARPWLKFSIRNGFRNELKRSSPTFILQYKKGFRGVAGSDTDFDQLNLGLRHTFSPAGLGNIDLFLKGGTFLNKANLYFMDYNHFLGNRTPFSTVDPVGSFRLLDYYRYSTASSYVTGSVHYQFRRFLVTTLTKARLLGFKENVFMSYLATQTRKPYMEVGYGLEGLFRLFRLEVAAAFEGGNYKIYGFRIGIATSLTANFQD